MGIAWGLLGILRSSLFLERTTLSARLAGVAQPSPLAAELVRRLPRVMT
jgi:hypothetical protein